MSEEKEHTTLQDYVAAGNALIEATKNVLEHSDVMYLSAEERDVLQAFRIFKKGITKHSIFKFETTPEK